MNGYSSSTRLVVAVVVAWIAAASSLEPVSAASPQSADAVARVVALEMRWSGLPGLGLAVLRDGTLAYRQAYGLANVELRAPMTTSTVVQLSSTTKAFTGVAAMLLAQDGVLDLDRPARGYIGELPPEWGAVTVRQLLNHTSGLPEVLECETDSREQALACVTELPPLDPPGARFRYTQTNYFLVLKIVEKITDRPFVEFMNDRIFSPLGMLSTTYAGSNLDLVPGRATSYYPDGHGGLGLREFDFPEYLYSAAGLNSSLEDLIRFLSALLSDKILRAGWRDQLWHDAPLADGGLSTYGLGWDLRTHGANRRSAGHEGGRLTTIRHFIDDGISVIVLSNGSGWRFDPDGLAERVAAVFAPALSTELDRSSSRLKASLLDGDLKAALEAARSLLSAGDVDSVLAERRINRIGYDLLERDRASDAAALLRLNVEFFPGSANAHDSLGEALAATGNRAEAIRHYRESLRLDPGNGNARKWIDRLEAEPAPTTRGPDRP